MSMKKRERKLYKRGKQAEKGKAFFRLFEYKLWLSAILFMTFVLFVNTARSGNFFGLTLRVNTNLDKGLVGYWTFDNKHTSLSTANDIAQSNNGTILGHTTYGISGAASSSFTTAGSGTWIVPDGVTKVTVHCWGGGGGGGATGTTDEGASGGGGGAFASSTISVTEGTIYSYTVGSGGSGGLTPGGSGGDGGDSSFGTNVCIANGGRGGGGGPTGGASGGTTASSTGAVTYAGGSSVDTGGIRVGTGGGGSAGTTGPGNNSDTTITGAAAVEGGGPGGDGNDNGGPGNTPVSGPGGGGGGGDKDSNGGAGYDGQIILYYTQTPTKVSMLTPGRLGSALRFDGVDDYVDIGNTGQTVNTVAFWMKAASTTDDIIDLNGTADITVSSGTLSANGFTSPTIYVDGNVGNTVDTSWRHVVITTTTGISASAMTIGLANGGYFEGVIDDVRVYNRVLSKAEISRLAQLGMTAKIGTTIGSNSALNSSLVGHWTFDGKKLVGTTTVLDTVGIKDGSTSGLSVDARTPGRLGSALRFDGVDDYVDIGNTGQTVNTVAFWMKAASTTDDIIDLNGTADITVSSGTLSANGFTSPTIYVDGNVGNTVDTSWRHVVITTTTGISASAMTIGLANGGYFEGVIDDVRVYSSILSASEVQRLYGIGR